MIILWGKNVIMEILKRDEIILMFSLTKAVLLQICNDFQNFTKLGSKMWSAIGTIVIYLEA